MWTASPNGFVKLREQAGGNAVMNVLVAALGDHAMQTPGLQVAAGQNLVMSFRHRHQFTEFFADNDGGVIEISTDGTTFVDVGTFANPSYTGTIAVGNGNVLEGRPAYVQQNPSAPDFDSVTIDLGAGFGGQTVFIRFRAAGDFFSDISSWQVDDVLFQGIANTPFTLVSPEQADCLVGERPIANAGPNQDLDAGEASALDGSASADPDGGAITFEWTQLSGPVLALSSSTIAQPTFTAPVLQSDAFARFQLVVRDPDGRVSLPDFVQIRILQEVIVDGPPDAGPVDAAVDGPPDAAPADAPDPLTPDANANPPLTGDGGGCCGASTDARGSLLLALGLVALLRRRYR